MKKVALTIALISSFVVCFSFMSMSRTSAILNANWSGVVSTTAGTCKLDYKFIAVGNHLVGTAVSPQGEASIVNGTINGTDMSFTVSYKGSEVKHTGKYNSVDNTISMDLDLGRAKLHTVLTQGN